MIDKRPINSQTINSLLGFGCMRFPTKNGKINRDLATEMLDYAFKNGVNHFDTAEPYHEGESEYFLGDYLKKHTRESFTISTKMPVWNVKKHEDFEEILDNQLEKLKVDYIDFYLLHALNKNYWDKIRELNVFDFIKKVQSQGKIKYIGFSFHDDYETFTNIVDSYSWDFCLMQLNYIDINHQQGIRGYKYCEENKIPVWIMEPLKGGKLSNLAEDIVDKMRILNPKDSPTKWAFRWVASLPNVKLILSGMSSIEQVKENCNSFTRIQSLSDDEYNIIKEVKNEIDNRIRIDCTSCKYCLPCPVGVNIPRNFSLYNLSFMFNDKEGSKTSYDRYMKDEERASSCVSCGKCISKCPQNIDIPTELKKVSGYLK